MPLLLTSEAVGEPRDVGEHELALPDLDDPEVRREAVDVFRSVKWSEEITPIEGYPARSIHAIGYDEVKSMTASAGPETCFQASEVAKFL